jgi:hypothetical protein
MLFLFYRRCSRLELSHFFLLKGALALTEEALHMCFISQKWDGYPAEDI